MLASGFVVGLRCGNTDGGEWPVVGANVRVDSIVNVADVENESPKDVSCSVI